MSVRQASRGTGTGTADPSSRPTSPFVVFAFGSTHDALTAESILVDAGVGPKVMPLPRHRGKLCGVALRVTPENEDVAAAALAERGIAILSRDEIEDY